MNKIENLEILLEFYIYICVCDLWSWKCLRNLNSQVNSRIYCVKNVCILRFYIVVSSLVQFN